MTCTFQLVSDRWEKSLVHSSVCRHYYHLCMQNVWICVCLSSQDNSTTALSWITITDPNMFLSVKCSERWRLYTQFVPDNTALRADTTSLPRERKRFCISAPCVHIECLLTLVFGPLYTQINQVIPCSACPRKLQGLHFSVYSSAKSILAREAVFMNSMEY